MAQFKILRCKSFNFESTTHCVGGDKGENCTLFNELLLFFDYLGSEVKQSA